MYKVTVIAIAVAGSVLFGTAACGQKAQEPYRDAAVSHRNNQPAEVYTMPDGFSNVSSKCDGHGHRIFVAFKGDDNRAAIAVINEEDC